MKKVLPLVAVMAGLFAASVQAAPEINLGVLGGENSTAQIGNNQCVKTFLESETGTTVNIRNASDYSAVIQGLLGDQVDLVLNMSPKSYASVYLKDQSKVELVGITTDDTDNSKGYHSVVLVKADSPYQKLEDLKGKVFSFADPDSTSGFLIPNNQFEQKLGGNMDNQFNGFFKKVGFSGGHEQDILGVLNGQFDAAVTWTSMVGDREEGYSAGALRKVKENGFDDLMSNLRIIWQSPLIPNGPTIVRGDMDPDLKAKLVAAVRKLDKEDHSCFVKAAGGKLHLEETSISEYQTVIDLVKAQQKTVR
ncbi:phosphonate ABC transporter substrate-binding protein [Vibrio rumoiensis]|uniref:Phosphonate ABC transporter substrate-binding protein n=1 Tax=Vibrio rumoiensis 1S-45 TaxID=1188252 RepID=A0A1E5E2E2_9VIBR|nr:phosphonate ABC transporter substrate-binding protein [Vibrio rumoiensis]OEF25620.1 phosphonate ABC transporter substrate-binding protein [Vibrio rumoiensis 1S-45]